MEQTTRWCHHSIQACMWHMLQASAVAGCVHGGLADSCSVLVAATRLLCLVVGTCGMGSLSTSYVEACSTAQLLVVMTMQMILVLFLLLQELVVRVVPTPPTHLLLAMVVPAVVASTLQVRPSPLHPEADSEANMTH